MIIETEKHLNTTAPADSQVYDDDTVAHTICEHCHE